MNENIKEIAKIVIKELDKNTDGTFYTEEIATALYDAGYRKQSDTVKEFAEKVLKDISDTIDHNTSLIEAFGSVSPGVYNRASIANNACKGVYGTVAAIAKEYGVEVEKI